MKDTELLESYTDSLYQKLTRYLGLELNAFHYDNFKLEGDQLYCKGLLKSLMKENGGLRKASTIADILRVERLHSLGYDMPEGLMPEML